MLEGVVATPAESVDVLMDAFGRPVLALTRLHPRMFQTR